MLIDRKNIPGELFVDIKLYLDITWTDDATDWKIGGIIASGMKYLDKKLGAKADYTQDGDSRTLLFEYCRYMRDSALDVFENNYQSLILAMQNDKAVAAYVEKTGQTE